MTEPGVLGSFASIAMMLLGLLTACKSKNLVRPGDAPVSKEQQTAVLEGVETLREAFNKGGCQTIYDGAASGFRSNAQQDWLMDCGRLRGDLGVWRSFKAQSIVSCSTGISVVCVDGSAQFTKSEYILELAWSVNNGHRQLLWLILQGNGYSLEVPHQHQMLVDPPQPRRKAGISAKGD